MDNYVLNVVHIGYKGGRSRVIRMFFERQASYIVIGRITKPEA